MSANKNKIIYAFVYLLSKERDVDKQDILNR